MTIKMVRALQICVGILFLCSCIGHSHGYRTEDGKLNGVNAEKRFNQNPLFNKFEESPSSSGDKESEQAVRLVKRDPELSPVQKSITIQKVQANGPINNINDLYDAYQDLREKRLREEGYEVDYKELVPSMMFEFASELRDGMLGYPNLPDYNSRVSDAKRWGKFSEAGEKLDALFLYCEDLWYWKLYIRDPVIVRTKEDHLTKENIIRSIDDQRNDLRAKGETLSLVKEQQLLRRFAESILKKLPRMVRLQPALSVLLRRRNTSVELPKLNNMLRERESALKRPLNEYEKTEVTWNYVQKLLGLKILISKPQRA